MQKKKLKTPYLNTLSWWEEKIVDWSNFGNKYGLDGKKTSLGNYAFGFPFDSAITSDDGVYAVIYQKLGTKGLLLKEGQLLREINRSYYQSDVYEYPLAFAKAKNGVTYLVHCPKSYCQLDFENVETGDIETDIEGREPADFFHSRLLLSPDNQTLISRGWIWHPVDFVAIFDVEACLANPFLLDKSSFEPKTDADISAASFINNDLVLIGAPSDTEPLDDEPSERLKNGQLAIWNIRENSVSKPITPKCKIGGHLTVIDDTFAWDLLDFPKIINYHTGEIVAKAKTISSGKQISSIVHHLENEPKIAFHPSKKRVAIYQNNVTEVLSLL